MSRQTRLDIINVQSMLHDEYGILGFEIIFINNVNANAYQH
jgi:hypothetical protein